MSAAQPILKVHNINTFYGEAHVLHGVSLEVMEGEAIALLGRNGAGKTTTLRSIMGLSPAVEGNIIFKNIDITNLATNDIANLGIGWVPDNRRIFPTLTVQQNLEIAYKKGPKGEDHWNLERVYRHFPKLESLASRKGDNLSGGEQQMLSIARTLMGNPELILLDEPSEGLAPLIVKEVMGIIQELTDMKITTVLVEQNSALALRVCSKVYVLDDGRNTHTCGAEELIDDDNLMQKLLSI
ncbi:MAG: ABC transporter ATP-binding protein [Pseudomonadota bacterium]